MDKLKIIKVPEEIKNCMSTYKIKYDELFDKKIISKGRNYYNNKKIIDFKYNNKTCEAVVEGSVNYNVKIKFKKDKIDKVYCSCPYHESNKYCKHIYAALLYNKINEDKIKLKKIYNNNYNKIKDIVNSIKKLTTENEKYLTTFVNNWAKTLPKFHELYLSELNEKYNQSNDNYLILNVKNSYYVLNNVIYDYNQLLDYIDKGKKEFKKSENSKINFSFTIDDSKVLDYIDEILVNFDVEQLKYFKKKFEENNENTSFIDETLKERIRRDKIAEEIRKKQKKEEKRRKKTN